MEAFNVAKITRIAGEAVLIVAVGLVRANVTTTAMAKIDEVASVAGATDHSNLPSEKEKNH